MKINCQLPNNIEGETLDFDIDIGSTSIHELKGLIHDRTGTPIEHQILQIDNKKLSSKFDKKKLSNLNLSESSNIRMLYDIEGGCGGACDICGIGGGCRCTIL